ncbi:DNA ligase [Pectobacterium phage Wc4-1]|uniref:DNA ligase n=1 Tax=Pectobacterium phage Wc4 TaxID=2652428 RepID=A0A5P8D4C0_9CAUD|nr:DNA ligase [Pectobacterium phage Wc4]QFP93988.1 DNA ligase [Pectobacterium phage Wc4-1]
MQQKSEPIRLFKVDSKGKLRYWFAESIGAVVNTYSGIVGAEKTSQICETYTAIPTNVGKKNERDGAAQAIFEVAALYKAKVTKKRYFEDMAAAQGYVSEDVQLAQDYTKKNNHLKIQWGQVDGQFKLDGVRCRVTYDDKGVFRVWSRENKSYNLPEPLLLELMELFKRNPTVKKLDGELYVHGEVLEDISSMVKDVDNSDRYKLQFWMYDLIEPEHTWEQRRERVNDVRKNSEDFMRIVFLDSTPLNSPEDADKFIEMALELGFEGMMFRNWKAKYGCGKRIYGLQKYKKFMEEEFFIIAVHKDKRGQAVFEMKNTRNGDDFKARWKASNEKRKNAADNPEAFIGTRWTVRFHHWSYLNVPIHPVAIVERNYE